MSHAAKNNDGLDLFCASPPPDLVPDGYGPDVVTVSYALTTPSNSGVGAASATERLLSVTETVVSASRPTLCPPRLLLQSKLVSVNNLREGGGATSLITITVLDRDSTPELNPCINAPGGSGAQVIQVKVISSRYNEPSDLITLRQANASEGSFTGTINISRSSVPGAENDGLVSLEPGDWLRVIYSPPALFLTPRTELIEYVQTMVNCTLRLFPLPVASIGAGGIANMAAKDVSVVGIQGALTIEVRDSDRNADVLTAGESVFRYPPSV